MRKRSNKDYEERRRIGGRISLPEGGANTRDSFIADINREAAAAVDVPKAETDSAGRSVTFAGDNPFAATDIGILDTVTLGFFVVFFTIGPDERAVLGVPVWISASLRF